MPLGRDTLITVRFAYGRRGSTLKEGTKASQVSQSEAYRVYNQVVGEKRAKGYTEDTRQESASWRPSLYFASSAPSNNTAPSNTSTITPKAKPKSTKPEKNVLVEYERSIEL